MKYLKNIAEQLKILGPNLASYGAAFLINKFATKYGITDSQEYKNLTKIVTSILTDLPNTEDTVFSSFKRGLTYKHLAWKKYSYVKEFEEQFCEPKNLKKVEDSTLSDFIEQINEVLKPEVMDVGFLEYGNLATIKQLNYSDGTIIAGFFEQVTFGNRIQNVFYTNRPDSYQELFFSFLRTKGNNILLKTDQNENIDIEPVKHWSLTQETFVSPASLEIISDLKNYIKHNMPRNYLLVGPPGSGKSTLCYQIANQVSDRCLKIDNRVIRNHSTETVEKLLNYSRMRVIIFDDIDRNEHEVALSIMLYYVEAFKSFDIKPIFLATANNLDEIDEALLRPGRFDRILTIDSYEAGTRQKFIRFLLPQVPEKDLEQLTSITDNFTNASVNEVCEQYKIGIPIEVIDSDMTRRTTLLKEASKKREKRNKSTFDANILDDFD